MSKSQEVEYIHRIEDPMACNVVNLSFSRRIGSKKGENQEFLVFQSHSDKLTRRMNVKRSNIIIKSD